MSKKIVLEEIRVQNFLSFEDEQVLRFQKKGIHIISGENQDMTLDTFADEVKQTNSAGKSSVFRAVDFAFFGESPNKKIKMDSLINKTHKKNMIVSLSFYVDGVLWRIERYRKVSSRGSGLSLLRTTNEGTESDESFADTKLTQEKIESLIGMNHDTFLYSVLLTKESSVLSFIELPWYQRSVFLENIVRLDKLREYTKKIKERLSEDRKRNDFLSKEIYAHQSTLSSLLSLNKKLLQNKKRERNERHALIESLKEELNDLLKNTDISMVESFISFAVGSNDENLAKKRYKEALSKAEYILKSYKNYKTELLSNEEKLKAAYIPKIENCSICQKEIERKSSDEYIDSLKDYLRKNRESLVSTRTLLKDSLKVLRESKNLLNDIQQRLFLFDKESFKSMNKNLRKKILDDILSGGDGKKSLTDMDPLKNRITSLESYKNHLDDIRHNREDIKNKKSKLQEFLNEQKEILERIKIGEFWDSTLDFRNEGSLKNYIMSKIVPVFNSFLSSMIDVIFEGKMSVSFDSSWNETILYDGEEFDYNQLSLGEKAKINLCISLSIFSLLRINVGGASVIFFDEVFSSMDAASCEKFIQIFRDSYSKELGLYIIHHSHGLKNFTPDSNIKVVKREKRSQIYS